MMSNEPKFTPGVWYVDSAPWMGLYFGVLCEGEVIATCSEVNPDADKYNSYLIAQAPRMYAALEAMAKGEGLPPGETIEDILLAARGEV